MSIESGMFRAARISCCVAFSLGLLAGSAEGSKKMLLAAAIEVPAGQTDARAFQIKLRITNPASRGIAVLNPDMGVPSPATKWPFSKEVYQTSLLISFGYLSISVIDEAGKELSQQAIQTWATPVLQPKLELGPGNSFELTIPIGNFYQLEPGKAYQVAIEYGDQNLRVSTRTSVTVR